jgi:hypothetical protein
MRRMTRKDVVSAFGVVVAVGIAVVMPVLINEAAPAPAQNDNARLVDRVTAPEPRSHTLVVKPTRPAARRTPSASQRVARARALRAARAKALLARRANAARARRIAAAAAQSAAARSRRTAAALARRAAAQQAAGARTRRVAPPRAPVIVRPAPPPPPVAPHRTTPRPRPATSPSESFDDSG